MRILVALITWSIVLLSCQTALGQISAEKNIESPKQYQLVLIHGLANKHRWSYDFLDECLQTWGSGRVFIVYTGTETTVTTREINGRKLIVGGGNGNDAGTGSLDNQVSNLTNIINILKKDYGLQTPFSIIAHSMGGLVARQYSFTNIDSVAGLVTLGTPHKGSPLANSFQWVGFFLESTDAINDLKPANMIRFNEKYPIDKTPITATGEIQTIRGLPEWSDCYGWIGELFFGWQILSRVYETDNDGLVPNDSAIIEGAKHIADFPHYDHCDLVKEPDVAKTAAEYLP